MTGQVSRLHQMAVERPELFTTSESSDQFQILVKIVILFARTPPGIPETILGLEPMLTLWYHDWCEGDRFNLELLMIADTIVNFTIVTAKSVKLVG